MAARWMRAQVFFTALRLPVSPQAAELTCAGRSPYFVQVGCGSWLHRDGAHLIFFLTYTQQRPLRRRCVHAPHLPNSLFARARVGE